MNILHNVLSNVRSGQWIEAHNFVQSEESQLAAWLHGMLHIQEGDLEDAVYYYDKANRHFAVVGHLKKSW